MTILIVDDHPLLRAGLVRLLAIEFAAAVAEAANAAEGLRLFRALAPEITVLDLNLPGEGGLSLLQTMRADDPHARVIVLSMRSDAWSAEAALRLGAVGYLSKSAPPELILEAVRRARAGQNFVDPAVVEVVTRGQSAEAAPNLSVQDLDLLRLLLDGQRPEQIARSLGITEKTVANRKSMLRSKLGATSDLELLKTAEAAGFVGG
ncbi:MAG TPA: response regulator transcription factor [Stellaceae bacterium]|nr:response regulator transcription factor [Stellaceae bacterium]